MSREHGIVPRPPERGNNNTGLTYQLSSLVDRSVVMKADHMTCFSGSS